MIKFEHPYLSPHLTLINGEMFIFPGAIKVPLDTTYKDIKWIKKINKESNIKEDKTWKFMSSSGNGEYTVWKNGNILSCNCMGFFRSRGNCKHVKEVKKELGIK